jgi:hypothetical protein
MLPFTLSKMNSVNSTALFGLTDITALWFTTHACTRRAYKWLGNARRLGLRHHAFSVLLQPGQKAFAIVRTGASALAGVSLRNVGTACPYGICNYGAVVSVVPSTRLSPRASRP